MASYEINVTRHRVPEGSGSMHRRVLSKVGTAFSNLELDSVICMSVVNVRSLDN